MIFKMFRRIAVVLLAVSIVGSAGLGLDTSIAFGAAKTVKAKSVSLNHKTYTIKKGKTLKLKASVKPQNATQKTIVWTSSNKKIATVKNGKVKAKKKGKVTITAAVKGTKKKAKATIYVGTPVKKAFFPTTSVTLETGQVTTVAATLSPDKPTVKGIAYSSSNPNVASVGAGGVITAVSAGTAIITAKPKDEAGKSATLTVVVNNRIQNNSEVKPAPPEEPDEPVIDNLEDSIIDTGDIQHLSDQGLINVAYGEDGGIEYIDGSFTNEKVNDAEAAIELLNGEKSNFLRGFNSYNSYVEEVSSQGENFYRFSPRYNGIRVVGSQVILTTESDGTVNGLVSSFKPAIYTIETEALISEEDAESAAINAVMNLDEVKSFIGSDDEKRSLFNNRLTTSTELVIYAADSDDAPVLAYEVKADTFFEEDDTDDGLPLISMTYYIYANTDAAGSVYLASSSMEDWADTAVSVGSVSDISSDYVMNAQADGDRYRLVDNSRNITVYKARAIALTRFGYNGDIAASPVLGGNKIDDKAVYAMMNMEKIYDYYSSLGLKSYDGNGSAIRVFYGLNAKNLTATVAWDDGKKYGYDPAIIIDKDSLCERGLDVLGHEFTHAVMQHANGGLCGGEGGALSEGYPDIMGNLIEGKTGDDRWKLGEDTYAPKTSMGEAAYYSNYDKSKDVHENARIFSHAAALMMSNARAEGVSNEEWAKVFYDSMYRLPSDATFLQARRAVLYSANLNGFTHDQQEAIKAAFEHVGIVEPNATRIILNWGEKPEDLDSHLIGKMTDGSGQFHIYFGDKTKWNNDNYKYIADLDYDDTTSYGPEVTTIHAKYEGTYYFFVHDYTTGTDSSSTAMAQSGATIKVYRGNDLLKEYTIAPGSAGTIWNVCKITIKDGGVSVDKIDSYGTQPTDENGNVLDRVLPDDDDE